MKNRRLRSFVYAGAALGLVWLVVWAGFALAKNLKMTAEKVNQYVSATDLTKLSAEERARALRELADKVNALPPDERQRWRRDAGWKKLFGDMTEQERGQFIDATLPTGFKQMLDAFGKLPEDRRKKLVDDAIKNLKEMRPDDPNRKRNSEVADYGAKGPPQLSPELEQKVRMLGLQTFYSESSAETKAELAPFLEELQQQIRNGRGFRN